MASSAKNSNSFTGSTILWSSVIPPLWSGISGRVSIVRFGDGAIRILLVGTAVTGTNRLSIYPFTGVLLTFSSFLYFFMDFLNFIFFIFYFFFFVLFCLFLIYLLISFFFNWWKDLLFLTFMTNVINKIHKDKWSERIKQFYSNTFRRVTPSSVGRLIELNVEAARTTCVRCLNTVLSLKCEHRCQVGLCVYFSCIIFLVQFLYQGAWR